MVNNAINYIKSEQMLRTVAIGAVAKRFGSKHLVDLPIGDGVTLGYYELAL